MIPIYSCKHSLPRKTSLPPCEAPSLSPSKVDFKSSKSLELSRSPHSPPLPFHRPLFYHLNMSFFGNGARAAPSGQPDQARLAEAAMELEAVSDLFNRIVSSCHAKCISPRYAEPELNKGEGVCVDR